uniref:Ribosomal protein L13 n=1 Tax=Spumella sp. Baekdong012001B8 TaxID=2782410 RepID=A0A7S6PVB0_9STRA|nr:ribosomal protein L13 [Spumella sp. Baekdong012001B8]
MNITQFPKKKNHIPQCFIINAQGKTLGRLATVASKLLLGKETSFFSSGVDQGNFLIIYNASGVMVTGKKEKKKLYYRNSQRPGSLKIETFSELKERIPARIIENAIWGMLPKGILGRQYFRRLYVYSGQDLAQKKKYGSIKADLVGPLAFTSIDL